MHHNYRACALSQGAAFIKPGTKSLKLTHPRAHALEQESHHNEKPTYHNLERSSCSWATREKPANGEDPEESKNKLEKNIVWDFT